jgi:hypothetical protein
MVARIGKGYVPILSLSRKYVRPWGCLCTFMWWDTKNIECHGCHILSDKVDYISHEIQHHERIDILSIAYDSVRRIYRRPWDTINSPTNHHPWI